MRSARRSFYKLHRRTVYGVGTNAYDRKSYGEDELEWPINNLPFGLKAHQPPDKEDEMFEDEMPEEEIYLGSSIEESLYCIEACNKQWCDMNNVERVLGLSRYDIVVEFEVSTNLTF